MIKKWKIFGVQTKIEWYDIKTAFKQFLRKITYSFLFQELICLIFIAYMKLVFFSCKKIFINDEILDKIAREQIPTIATFWHNRLMMIPFLAARSKKKFPDYNFMTLASRHGDGRFVGRIMEKFGLISIYGSSQDGRKSSRGIDIGSFKKIFAGLKKGYTIGITPDGPRGPNQKINGEIINIARAANAGILPLSYSCSRFIEIKTWDRFKIPLPFSTLCFYFDEKIIFLKKDLSAAEIEEIKITVETRMNFAQEQSKKIATQTINL
ncbi:MAG: lysophospholipid acyltransferase family protein [Rickettsiales bacterium]|nr:lysophospholipid acyltransferase family protein [Rickettsiales bacterium]